MPPLARRPRLAVGCRSSGTSTAPCPAELGMGDGVIGSPPAFGAGKSRFESESPSRAKTSPGQARGPGARRSVSTQQPTVPSVPTADGVAAVVVLAAGQGTRMRSARPKVLHELGGRSMLGHVLAACAPLVAGRTVVVVGAGRAMVEDHLGRIAPDALPVVQEEQLGSGHAAALALDAVPDVDGPVLLVNGDAPLLRTETVTALIAAHRSAGAVLTVLTAEVDDPTGLGRI